MDIPSELIPFGLRLDMMPRMAPTMMPPVPSTMAPVLKPRMSAPSLRNSSLRWWAASVREGFPAGRASGSGQGRDDPLPGAVGQ